MSQTQPSKPACDYPEPVTFIRALLGRPLFPVVGAILGGFLAGLFAFLLTPGATATAVVGLRTPTIKSVLVPGISGNASLGRYTTQRSLFMKSDELLKAAATELGYSNPADVANIMGVKASPTANAFTITVTTNDADEATQAVNVLVSQYRTLTKAEVDRRSIGVSSDVANDSQRFGDGVEFVQLESRSLVERSLMSTQEIILGAGIGAVFAAFLAWARADVESRKRYQAQLDG
jgi:uncharacterized protein involved in exopolysaccharide biosynthesis